MNTNTAVRRSYPAKPIRTKPVHETKVVDMVTARELLKSLYLKLKKTIDQETLLDFTYDGTTTNLAFVIGTIEMKFNLVEGGQS
ncbi:MAG: hypothetical protein ACOYM7_05530 [Paludibacter sp.]